MNKEKKFDSLLLFTAAAYLLILVGFIEIAAAAYLLILVGWLVREMYRGFIIGRIEHKEYKARERAWKPEIINVGKKERKQPALAEESIMYIAWGPL